MFLPVLARIEQLCAATLFKLQIEQNDVRRIEIVRRQFEEDIVGLLKGFVFSQAIIQITVPTRLNSPSTSTLLVCNNPPSNW